MAFFPRSNVAVAWNAMIRTFAITRQRTIAVRYKKARCVYSRRWQNSQRISAHAGTNYTVPVFPPRNDGKRPRDRFGVAPIVRISKIKYSRARKTATRPGSVGVINGIPAGRFMRRIADPRIAGPGDARPRPEVIAARGTAGSDGGACLVIHRRIETVAVSRRRTGVVDIV